MERVYYIDHVSNDDINALSLKLNSMQEVSHIKINKDSISFNCARPDNIQNYLRIWKMKKMHTKYKTFFLNIVFMKMFN